ncbi:MAG: L-lactate permease [Brevibacterium aurantiacum]|uniref:L-lactate permease n=3 Tax=Brevibacterium TaxID=1696 RepID=A0A2A3YU45_BREAU|nr:MULTISPECIES: L-lactate permease [Brevibacterium]AZL07045.1 L-lactate permease [Brevibacterium aurantiacum]AZL14922.1 L-lactate permease [Brevibacterium aurantiacum]MDN5595010.1 L-lactate permease [Brevibacterium sp.]PCC42781.1 lactate permease [Brevibacterium aurantiacum]PCC46957.1 lactate permease [Brevibacterium aurantiacum]
MYTPEIAPLADSLMRSSLVALLPLLTIFVTLGFLKWKAHWAGLAAVIVALIVAIFVYGMPVGLAGLSASQGFAFGLFPIMWIVITAIWLYELTVKSGHFEDLRLVINVISDDPRVQAILVAFCFGGLLEALAGFGAPVAITGVMLIAVGFTAMRAAVVVLVANTAPVAFGAIAIPIITAGNLTGIDYKEIGAMVGHQTPLLAAVVPLFLIFLVDGKRGLRQLWPLALVVGIVFGAAQFVSANYLSVEMTDIVASLMGLAAAVVMLQFWKPVGGQDALDKMADERSKEKASAPDAGGAAAAVTTTVDTKAAPLTGKRVFMALFPYLMVIVIFSGAKLIPVIDKWLASTDIKIPWPGLDGNIMTAAGELSTSTVYNFQWLSSPGTMLLVSGIIVAIVYKMTVKDAVQVFVDNVVKMRFSILTVGLVLALAYVMNLSGQTITIGTWIAGTGALFAFLSPILGWLGTAVTGSDTSANALFATLQQTAATKAGIDPVLLVAANSSGGVVGKMISPQNLTIAATAVGLLGQESSIFRRVIWWSLGMLVVMCLLVGLQSTVLSWMLPGGA